MKNDINEFRSNLYNEINVEISLLNVSGEVVKVFENQKYPAGTWKKSLDVSDLPEGIYLFTIKTKEQVEMHKLIVKR